MFVGYSHTDTNTDVELSPRNFHPETLTRMNRPTCESKIECLLTEILRELGVLLSVRCFVCTE